MSRRIINIGGSFLGILPPNEIFGNNLYDWWDFTDNSTLSLTGSAINSVSSKKSGSTRAFVASGGARPTIVANQVNSLQVASFDGLASFMQVNSSTSLYNFLHNATGGTVITVFKATNSTIMCYISNQNAFSQVGIRIMKSSSDFNFANITNGSAIISQVNSGAISLNQFHFVINTFDSANATLLDRIVSNIDNTTDLKSNTTSGAFSVANATNNLTLGRRPIGDLYLKGDIAEIIISQNQPTPTQLTQIQAYLTAKYGTFPI
jgi:hypothetical protein